MTRLPENIHRDLLDHLQAAVFITDADGLVFDLNDRALSLVRLTRSAAVGHRMENLLPAEAARTIVQSGRDALATGRDHSLLQFTLILPGRGFRYFDARAVPLRSASTGRWVAHLLHDTTTRTRRELATERARESAEAEARARQAFLARMSHEIRTPMNGIIGMTELALQSNPKPDIEDYLKVIHGASDSLLVIINNVLDFAKGESGRMVLESIPLDPGQLLEETVTLLHPLAEEKDLELTASVEIGLPKRLLGDPTRIRQVLTNLMGNALKFTEKGSVLVSMEYKEPDRLVTRVKDSGIGIPEESLENIFEPFAQSEAKTSREFGGTGLGLAICRSLARLMDGEVEVESQVGRGSVFTFSARLPQTEEGASGVAKGEVSKSSWQWSGETILVAEDNRVNRRVAEGLLTKVNLQVLPCENGREAVETWKHAAPDLILMDVQMPELDGLEATRAIRDAERSDTHVPIVAMTAHVLEEERRACEEAGMDGWLTKPVKPADLYRELARFLPAMLSSEE